MEDVTRSHQTSDPPDQGCEIDPTHRSDLHSWSTGRLTHWFMSDRPVIVDPGLTEETDVDRVVRMVVADDDIGPPGQGSP